MEQESLKTGKIFYFSATETDYTIYKNLFPRNEQAGAGNSGPLYCFIYIY
jgi:hypothetical protein